MPSATSCPRLDSQRPLRVVIAIDVEEEGLFCGHYPSQDLCTTNVAALEQLVPLTSELGLPLTLLCTHAVLADARAKTMIQRMGRDHGAEIGAHLHHWHTPPLEPTAPSPGTAQVPDQIMAARIATLLDLAAEVRGQPITSFRQGRWDLRPGLWPLLARAGVTVDSSVHPLRFPKEGPDHFMAPIHPFRVEVEGRKILEVPIGVVPLTPGLGRSVHTLATRLGQDFGQGLLQTFPHWGCMSLKPVWHGLTYLKAATRLLVLQGGRVLSLTWHSSEMMAGCCPHLPTKAHVDGLLRRIRQFLEWLVRTFPVRGVTLEGLAREDMPFPRLGRIPASRAGDWCPRHLVDENR
jgi:hypothetical protein